MYVMYEVYIRRITTSIIQIGEKEKTRKLLPPSRAPLPLSLPPLFYSAVVVVVAAVVVAARLLASVLMSTKGESMWAKGWKRSWW